ncbi:MAG: outer membrane beta-barrel protein [Gemmatimonadales bacterium]
MTHQPRSLYRAALGAALLHGAAADAAAQRARHVELGGFAAYARYGEPFGLAEKLGGGIRLGYLASERLGLELDGVLQPRLTPAGTTAPVEAIMVDASVAFNLPTIIRNNLYVLGGYSLLYFGATSPWTDHGVHGAVGDRLFLGERTALRLEARVVYVPHTAAPMGGAVTHTLATAGLSLFEGRRRPTTDVDQDRVEDRKDRCPATPSGVTVDRHGCPLDPDGDQVAAGIDRCPDTPRGVSVDDRGCPSPVPDSTAQPTSRPRPWSLYAALYNVFDSNIDHNQEGVDSYGILFGIGGRYVNRSSIGTVELVYDGVVREYTNTDQWSQPGHEAGVSLTRRLTRHWSLGVVAEASMNGSTEDRVLRDEYSVEPRVEYRFDPKNRLRLYTEYLLKRYPDPTGQDAVDPRVGIQFRHILGDDGSWTLGARYEINHADSTRYRYTAWTFNADVASAIGARSRAWWSVRYRARSYTSRQVTVDDIDVLRRDDGWIAATTWEYSPRSGWALGLNYRYELYDSNDPRREFRAHTVALSWKHGWW